MTPALPRIPYETRMSEEKFGALALKIERLSSLDRTIDALFDELKRGGEERLLEDLCPYFGKVWPAARGLAQWLAELPREEIEGKRFLEIGCGLAIPSLVISARGGTVVATDFHPDVPWFLARNLELNPGLSARIEYRELDWRQMSDTSEKWDWVVGSDILYERAHMTDVAVALDRIANRAGAEIAVGDPGRPYLQGFVDELKKRAWREDVSAYRVPDPPDDALKPGDSPSPTEKDVFLLHFRKAKA